MPSPTSGALVRVGRRLAAGTGGGVGVAAAAPPPNNGALVLVGRQ